MCKAIRDMMADERAEGRLEERLLANQVFKLYLQRLDFERIAAECNTTLENVQGLLEGLTA